MKKTETVAAIGFLCFLIFSVISIETKANSALPWRDELDYPTKTEMKNAGWNLVGEQLIEVGDGTVTMTNDGVTGPGVHYAGEFPSGVYDFVAETSAKRVDTLNGGECVDIITEKHTYSGGTDAASSEYRLIRDGALLVKAGGYTPLQNTWESIKLERRANKFRLYIDDELKLIFEETDDTPSPVTGAGTHAGWLATIKYDYFSVKAYESTIVLGPSAGFASTTVVGSGFSDNSEIEVTWDDTIIPSVPNPLFTDATGNFACLISIPTQSTPGTHTIKATDASGKWATATFSVVNMTGPQGPPGETGDLQLVVNAFTSGASILAICLATIALVKKRS